MLKIRKESYAAYATKQRQGGSRKLIWYKQNLDNAARIKFQMI